MPWFKRGGGEGAPPSDKDKNDREQENIELEAMAGEVVETTGKPYLNDSELSPVLLLSANLQKY